MATDAADSYESLMQFLYLAPIGLVQTTIDGSIEMLNPVSSRLMMPLSRDGTLDNLYAVLQGVVPQLRALVDAHAADTGVVCEGIRFASNGGEGGRPQVLSISLMKLDAARLMVTLTDVTVEAERERQG